MEKERGITIITTRRLGKQFFQDEDVYNLAVYGTTNREQVKMLLAQQEHLKAIEDETTKK